jgi:DNA-binding transcriptional LysR family regulator
VRTLAQREATELAGRYTLGVHPSVGLGTLPLFLPRLLQTFEDLEFHLVHHSSRELTERTINFQIDFGLVVNPRPHPDLTITQLYVSFRRTVRSTNLELTAAGAGVGLLPRRVAQRDAGLKMLSSALPTIRDRHCLVYRTDAQRSAASRALVKWIRAQLASMK